MSNAPKGMPVCPNHNEFLEGLPFPMKEKGSGMCPISGVMFAYEVSLEEEDTEQKVDKFGNMYHEKKWKVMGDDT